MNPGLPTRAFALVLVALASTTPRVRADDGGIDASIADAGVADASVRDASTADASLDAAVPEEPELPPEHRPSVSIRLEPASGTHTGEIVRAIVTVDSVAGDDVTIPAQSFAPLELHRRTFRETTRNGRNVRTFTLELLALAPGDVTLAPITIRVLTPDGLVGSVATDPVSLRIQSVLGNEPNAQPKPPTRPRSLTIEDKRPLYLIWTVLAMVAGALIALAIKRWWTRRPKPVPPPPPPRPAWEIAFEKLEALRRDGPAMISEGRVGPWIDALSDTVREYLGRRYDFDGLEFTSDEVVRRLSTIRLHAIPVSEIQVFLGDCDLVKFAQASMTNEQAEAMFRHAHRIVRGTMPTGESFGQVGGAS